MISFRKKKILRKKNCVLCNSKNLKEVLDFGKTPLANSYPKTLNEKDLNDISQKIITIVEEKAQAKLRS